MDNESSYIKEGSNYSRNSNKLKNRLKILKTVSNQKYLLLMVVPFIIWFIIFCYIPMFGIVSAFQNFEPLKGYFGSKWVGIKHFELFLTGYHFPIILKNTVVLTFLKILFGFPAPIILALLLNEMKNGLYKKTVQTISYLPYFVSWVIVLGIWGRILSSDGGVVNNFIMPIFNIEEPIPFLSLNQYMWPIAILTEIWKGVGWGTIIYLAALSAINIELYEAARIDGAGRWKQVWHITLPGIKPTIAILFIFSMGGLVSGNFEQLWILGTPAVRQVTEVIDTYVARVGLMQGQFSLGTAAGLMTSVVSFLLVLLTNKIVTSLGEEGIW